MSSTKQQCSEQTSVRVVAFIAIVVSGNEDTQAASGWRTKCRSETRQRRTYLHTDKRYSTVYCHYVATARPSVITESHIPISHMSQKHHKYSNINDGIALTLEFRLSVAAIDRMELSYKSPKVNARVSGCNKFGNNSSSVVVPVCGSC